MKDCCEYIKREGYWQDVYHNYREYEEARYHMTEKRDYYDVWDESEMSKENEKHIPSVCNKNRYAPQKEPIKPYKKIHEYSQKLYKRQLPKLPKPPPKLPIKHACMALRNITINDQEYGVGTCFISDDSTILHKIQRNDIRLLTYDEIVELCGMSDMIKDLYDKGELYFETA